jgi:hypothetical protein
MSSLRLAILVVLVVLWAGLSRPAVVRSQDALRSQVAGGAAPATAPMTTSRETLDRYCVTCHNQKTKTANLTLDTLNLQDVSAHADTWETVLRRLRTGTMPPVNSLPGNPMITYSTGTDAHSPFLRLQPATPMVRLSPDSRKDHQRVIPRFG